MLLPPRKIKELEALSLLGRKKVPEQYHINSIRICFIVILITSSRNLYLHSTIYKNQNLLMYQKKGWK